MNKKYKKKKLFGNNIAPSCTYCQNSMHDADGFICTQSRVLIDQKCKKFQYNPILRVPNSTVREMTQFSPKDFEL